MLNRDFKGLIVLLILVGLALSLIIFGSLFDHSIEINSEDDISLQHYNLEFVDQIDHMICHTEIFFQLTKIRYEFSIDHIAELSSIHLYQKQISIPIHIQIHNHRLIIKKRHWRKTFSIGNYSISINTHVNLSDPFQRNFIQQIWSSKYRILFPNNYSFPYLSHTLSRPTFNLNIISSDLIISNLPLNDLSQIAFALLHEYECRSMAILQLCLPLDDIDFFSYIFNYTLTTIEIFENHFSRKFPLNQLTLITVLELDNRMILKSGLVFLDQNSFLTNHSAEQILQQHQLIFLIIAYQWIETWISFDKELKWFGRSLAKHIANYLFNKINDPNGNNYSQIEQFMSTVVIDSLCNNQSNDIKYEKSEAFLTDYRLSIGDSEFESRIQQLIHHHSNTSFSNLSSILLTSSNPPDHSIVFFNSSLIDMHTFKLNSNCSISLNPVIYPFLNHSLNPFIHIFHPSWIDLINEMKTFRQQSQNSFSKIFFDSFLFNLANQLSIKYPLQLLTIFFQQSFSSLTKTDLYTIRQILQWYRSILSDSLGEKFQIFLQKLLHPFCLNHLWTRQNLLDIKHFNQQILNDILLELCCSINHGICLQQISNRNDPQILLQFIFTNQKFSSTDLIPVKSNQTDMLTSFNQLQIPSIFSYPDRIIMNIICQTIRQQNEKYWYDLIDLLKEKYPILPSAIMTGLSCSIRTVEQVDFYLNHLCPSTPFKWPCYRNILTYSSMKIFQQLNTIDNEQWPMNNDELVDFLFHVNIIQGNFSSHSMIEEFQSIIFTWLTTNQDEFLQWLEEENN